MELFIKGSVIIHVIAGALALLSGLIAILFRNDTRSHRPFGRFYFWCMTIVFITAVYVSAFHKNIFLFCISFFTYYCCLMAFRSLKLKNIYKGQKPKTLDWAIEIVFGTMNLAFVALGIYFFTNGSRDIGIICGVFGALGVRLNYSSLKRLNNHIEYSNYWLLTHIGGMLGSYIGAITAFLVNNNNWMKLPTLVSWLSPAVVLVPLLFYEVNKHKKKGKFIR